jgi:hypothetical protein
VSSKRAGERPTNVPVNGIGGQSLFSAAVAGAADASGITAAERAILATRPISVRSTSGRDGVETPLRGTV